MAAAKKKMTELVIPKQKIITFPVYIGGELLVVHQFSEKARREIRDKQGQKARSAKGVRDPHTEFVGSKYVDAKKLWEGLPCAAVRRSIIDAASFVDGVTKVQLRGAVFVETEGRTLDGMNIFPVCTQDGSGVFREDVVRLPTGSADLRYRCGYENWAAKLTLQVDPDILSAEQVHHLLERAGFSIGLCEARPQKSGDWGQFKLITEGEFKKYKPVKLTPKDFEVLKKQMSQRSFSSSAA